MANHIPHSAPVLPDEAPYVCPGCHAIAGPCLPGCIDAEIEEERRHLDSYGIYDDLDENGESP